MHWKLGHVLSPFYLSFLEGMLLAWSWQGAWDAAKHFTIHKAAQFNREITLPGLSVVWHKFWCTRGPVSGHGKALFCLPFCHCYWTQSWEEAACFTEVWRMPIWCLSTKLVTSRWLLPIPEVTVMIMFAPIKTMFPSMGSYFICKVSSEMQWSFIPWILWRRKGP